jgi:formylglycine-generating enzyme required for sulfatase activity
VITTASDSNITLTGTVADSTANISSNSGSSEAISLGVNPIEITVTAEDGTVKTYTVRVHVPEYTSANVGNMMYLPAGTYQRDATPTNLSTVSSFSLGATEVTRAQYLSIMGTDPSNTGLTTGTNDPVNTVNFYHAIAFCNKLSIAEGLTEVYTVTVGATPVDFDSINHGDVPTTSNTDWDSVVVNWSANGYRLPTEDEWQWAAIGADIEDPGETNTTGFEKAFAGSTGTNDADDYAWHDGTTTTSQAVGTLLPNEVGLFDMSGNSGEWFWNWWVFPAPTGALNDYRGPGSGSSRNRNGALWLRDASDSYYDIMADDPQAPTFSNAYYGFRVARN